MEGTDPAHLALSPPASWLGRLLASRAGFRAASVVVTLGIFALCLYPHPEVRNAPAIPYLDKIVHAVAFGGYGFVLRGARLGRGRVAAVGALVALLTEGLQAALTSLGRSGDVADAAADMVGLAVGAFAFAALARTCAPPRAV